MMDELVEILSAAMRDYPVAASLLAAHFVVPDEWRRAATVDE